MTQLLTRYAAPIFVLLWSTGFIGAKMGVPFAGPMTFLAQRFWLVALAMLIWCLASSAPWPRGRQWLDAAFVGVLINGGYLGSVYVAVDRGLEAGVAALITCLHPVVTAVLAAWVLGEALTGRKILGLALGVLGVAFVVVPKMEQGLGDWTGVALCIGALFAIALASIHQKKYCGDIPVRAGALVQFTAASIAVSLIAATESEPTVWTAAFIFALVWLVVVLSLGAQSLLYMLIRKGAASEVASLFFLVPPVAALMAWAMFGETMGILGALGFAMTALAVWLVARGGEGGAKT